MTQKCLFSSEYLNLETSDATVMTGDENTHMFGNIIFHPSLIGPLVSLCHSVSYFSLPAGIGNQASLEKWGVNTWDQAADDSPSLYAKPHRHPGHSFCTSHQRWPKALSRKWRSEERGFSDELPQALHRWVNTNRSSKSIQSLSAGRLNFICTAYKNSLVKSFTAVIIKLSS